jgi:hypothetical protein
MTTYSVGSRFWNLFWLVITLFPTVGLIYAVPLLVAVLIGTIRSGRWQGDAVFLALVLAVSWVLLAATCIVLARRIHEIRLNGVGNIQFARTIGATNIGASSIRTLEGKYERGYDNRQEWKLVVNHADGRVTIDRFPNVRDFVGRIEAFNPTVEIAGIWPMGAPQAPSRVGRVLP